MKELLLHPSTRHQLEAVKANSPQAILLAGPAGSGKLSLAAQLAGDVPEAYRLIVEARDNKALGIDAIRDINHFLSLKAPQRAGYNRYILIADAHLMTTEAQNALLKNLEEPPADTIIVLTASHEQSLLPTIRSRVQTVFVKRPVKEEVLRFFASDFDTKALQQAYAISGGLPGLMQALLGDEAHPLLTATKTARQILSGSVYERLLLVDELAKQRQLSLDMAFILQQMAHVSLQTATGSAAHKWQNIQKRAYEAAEALNHNTQPKLALTNLMLVL